MLILAESLSGSQLIIVGALLVGVAFILRRSAGGRKPTRVRDPLREVHEEFLHAESSYASQLNQMEVRLHDFAREVEGRIQMRLAVLDQLVVDADREIERLEFVLAQSRGVATSFTPPRLVGPDITIPQSMTGTEATAGKLVIGSSSLPLTTPQLASTADGLSDPRSRIYALSDAGFGPQEISEIVGQSASRVVLLLKLRPSPPAGQQMDAA